VILRVSVSEGGLLRDWDSGTCSKRCDRRMAGESMEAFTWEDTKRGSLIIVDVDAFFWGANWGWVGHSHMTMSQMEIRDEEDEGFQPVKTLHIETETMY
jgi:hypothetical protein